VSILQNNVKVSGVLFARQHAVARESVGLHDPIAVLDALAYSLSVLAFLLFELGAMLFPMNQIDVCFAIQATDGSAVTPKYIVSQTKTAENFRLVVFFLRRPHEVLKFFPLLCVRQSHNVIP